jgi:DNA-binding response OmpR family regulator
MKKILLVDDEKSILLALELFLKKNYQVKTATCAAEALKTIKNFSPDCFLIDLKLPQKSGLELITDLKKITKFKNTPVILLSAVGVGEDILAKNVVISQYLSKPFTLEELEEAILKIL